MLRNHALQINIYLLTYFLILTHRYGSYRSSEVSLRVCVLVPKRSWISQFFNVWVICPMLSVRSW